MKKVFLLLFMIIGMTAFAQSYFSVDAGYIPQTGYTSWITPVVKQYEYKDIFYLNLDFKYFPVKYIWIGGNANTYMLKDIDYFTFNPFYICYRFNAGVKYNNMELGYEHMCQHPITACGYIFDTILKEDSYYDKFYFKTTFYF